MTAETPAETLRRAAALMRQRAEAASCGPWIVESDGDGNLWIQDPVAPLACIGEEEDASTRADAEYIAAMHPGVALAIADQWDAVIEDMGDEEVVERGVAGVGVLVLGCLFTPRKTWTAALAAARAFLGEEAAT